MVKDKIKAFSISKYTYYEILMGSQLQSAGAQQSRLIEKYKQNNKTLRNQALGMKLGFGIGLAFLPIIPIMGYFQIFDAMNTMTIMSETLFFLSNFVMGIYFLRALLYILMAGLFPTGSLMTGNAFKMLQILPIPSNDLKKVAVMTLFRNIDISLILMTFGFPIVLLIVSQSIVAFILCLMVSSLNSLLGFCILIIVGRKINQAFSDETQNSKRANIIRIITIVGYMVLIFSTSMMIQWAVSLIDYFFEAFSISNPPMFLNIILSLIPLPITQGYVISLGIYTNYFSLELLISSIIGICIFACIVWILYKRSIQSLHEVTMTEVKSKIKKSAIEKKKEDIKVEIKSKTPLKSYLRKDLVSASHDMQTLIFILMPIIYPIIMIVSFQGFTDDVNIYPFVGIILWIIVLGIFLFTPFFLIVGLLNMEESGSSIIASLPIVPRDQARAKLLLMIGIQVISLMIISIILMIITNSVVMFLLLVSSLPIVLSFLFLIFELKIFLFGKLKYKYILEELHKEHKIAKWILIIGFEIGFLFLTILLGITLFIYFGVIATIITSLVIGCVGLLVLSFIFTRMFPKVDRMHNYKTGGFLKDHQITANIVLATLHIIFLTIPIFIELALFPIFLYLITINILAAYFLEFLIQFGCLTLLWFVIVPRGLKLPNRQKEFKEHARIIHLTTVSPLSRNIFIGLMSTVIFCFIIWIGAVFLGSYVFNPNILFDTPSLGNYGWFLFFVMLIPGIWEEVGFRGVMVPLLLKKYSQNKTIIINGLIFGMFHLFNLLAYLLLGGFFAFGVFYQAIYASFLGFAFAYMYIKTKSLLPCIILHYLIDSVGQLFLNVYFNNLFSASIFLIGFLGVIPSFFIILLVRLTVKEENKFGKVRTSMVGEERVYN